MIVIWEPGNEAFCDTFLLIVLANEMTIHNEKTIFSSPAEILDSTGACKHEFWSTRITDVWRQYFKVTWASQPIRRWVYIQRCGASTCNYIHLRVIFKTYSELHKLANRVKEAVMSSEWAPTPTGISLALKATETAGVVLMSPLPRLHHHDIMAIVELFFIYVLFVTACNVGALKIAQCTAVVSSAL